MARVISVQRLTKKETTGSQLSPGSARTNTRDEHSGGGGATTHYLLLLLLDNAERNNSNIKNNNNTRRAKPSTAAAHIHANVMEVPQSTG